jgi:hypothetical protein
MAELLEHSKKKVLDEVYSMYVVIFEEIIFSGNLID